MEHVVIGLTDEATARVAVTWVMERARTRPISLRLVAELDDAGSNPGMAKATLATASQRITEAVPGIQVEYGLADRPLLHVLLDESQAADLIVIAAHTDHAIRESRTPSFPVSLAARSRCPVVIVPADWQQGGGPVVVGVQTDDASDAAVAFAVREALQGESELRLVHTWEPWADLAARTAQIEHSGLLQAVTDRVRAESPALRLSAVLAEGVAHEGVIANSRDAQLIVLGTHGIGRETGLVLGSIHQEVMIRGSVPLAVVPLAAG
jgi:nucleotide-binding universal stress UspA family protein